MGILSIHTNAGALSAARTFADNSATIGRTQDRISTGYKVQAPADDASTFAIAQGIRGDQKARQAVAQAIADARGSATVALAGATQFQEIWGDLKKKIIEGMNPANTATQQQILEDDYQAMLSRARTVLENAAYKGINQLIETAIPFNTVVGSVQNLDYIINVDGDTARVNGQRLDLYWARQDNENIGTNAAAQQALQVFEQNWGDVLIAAGQLGSDLKTIDAHFKMNSDLSDAVTAGLGSLVDANLDAEAAKLISQQTRLALNEQALAIANQRPQIIQQLFRF
jgi:flagellin